MMFRKLYWVTEQVDSRGRSQVFGVYTSIPDLIHHGLPTCSGGTRLRLTLTKLDSDKEPFGTWCEPDFDAISDRLDEFVRTDEFTREHCQMLVDALHQRARVAA